MKKFIRAVGGMYHSVIYTDTDGKHFRFSGGTWTWRNHNPGRSGNRKMQSIFPAERPHNGSAGRPYHHGWLLGKNYPYLSISPDDKSGHKSLLDTLITTYGNSSIHDMIYSYAPPKENPTKKYEALLRKNTGIYDDTPIKKFTKNQFEKFWKTIQKMEGYQVGKIAEVYQISAVQALGKSRYQYCLKEDEWITGSECISLAEKGIVELEVCLSKLHHQFLRTPPNSLFQEKLENLICKKD